MFEVKRNSDVIMFLFLSLANHRFPRFHPRCVCRPAIGLPCMRSEAHFWQNRCLIGTNHTTATPPAPGGAGEAVLKYFCLTFKVKQRLFCQDSAAVHLCSSESAALHRNANAARAITPFICARLKNVHRADYDRL